MFKAYIGLGALWLFAATNAGAEVLRDPTRPLEYRSSTAAAVPLELNSILIGNGRRIAVINGREAREQERLGDILVLRILPNRVLVRRNGEDIELTLHNRLGKNAS